MSKIEKYRRNFMTDWPRKLIALVLAACLFAFVTVRIEKETHELKVDTIVFEGEDGSVREFRIITKGLHAMLKMRGDDIGANGSAKDYKIVVTVPKEELKKEKRFLLKFGDWQDERRRYRIEKPRLAPEPESVAFFTSEGKVTQIENVEIDVVREIGVTVTVPEEGRLRSGLTAQKTLSPASVKIRGVSEALKNIKNLSTRPLVLNESMRDDFQIRLLLEQLPEGVELLEDGFPRNSRHEIEKLVTVDVRLVRSRDMEKPVEYPGLSLNVLFDQKQEFAVSDMSARECTVKVTTTSSVKNQYKDMEKPEVFLDLRGVQQAGKHHAQVKGINLPPPGMAEIHFEPDFVDVTLVEISTASKPEPEPAAAPEEKVKGAEPATAATEGK